MSDLDFFSISIAPASWAEDGEQITDIRRHVFVEEQQVPEEIELDEYDAGAKHWLALDPDNKAIGTIRLVDNARVGRLAVLRKYRGKGVGSALMRRLILDASSDGISNLTLNGQTSAIPFYEKFGFQCHGPVFQEGGIEHRQMTLDLGPYRYLSKDYGPPDTGRHPLTTADQFAEAIVSLARQGRRDIRLFSEELNLPWLENKDVLEALQKFAVSQPSARICILIRYTSMLESSFHPLLELQKRLSSHIEVRQLSEEFQPQLIEYMIFDESALVRVVDATKPAGFAAPDSAHETRPLINEFDHMWQYSSTPPGLRQLEI